MNKITATIYCDDTTTVEVHVPAESEHQERARVYLNFPDTSIWPGTSQKARELASAFVAVAEHLERLGR